MYRRYLYTSGHSLRVVTQWHTVQPAWLSPFYLVLIVGLTAGFLIILSLFPRNTGE